MFLSIVSIYSTKNTYKLYSVSAKEKWNIGKTLWYDINHMYHQLFDEIHIKLVESINYNVFGIIKSVFNGICNGLNIIETEYIKIKL